MFEEVALSVYQNVRPMLEVVGPLILFVFVMVGTMRVARPLVEWIIERDFRREHVRRLAVRKAELEVEVLERACSVDYEGPDVYVCTECGCIQVGDVS